MNINIHNYESSPMLDCSSGLFFPLVELIKLRYIYKSLSNKKSAKLELAQLF